VVGDRLEDPTPRRSAVYVAVIEQLVSARCTARVDASMPCWVDQQLRGAEDVGVGDAKGT
jgi:hypothetical protein